MRFIAIFLGVVALAQAASPQAPAPAMSDEEKTIYALGMSIYRSLKQFDLSPAERALVQRGFADAAAGTPAIDLKEWEPRIELFARARAARAFEEERAASQAYLDKAATEPGAIKTDSGMVYRELKAGTGPSPAATDTVKVNYRGTLVNGTEFDSSYARKEPAQFALGSVIPCWTEGLQKMKPGGKAELVCPSNLAYGNRGRPGIPGGAALIFDVELVEIVGAPAPAAQ